MKKKTLLIVDDDSVFNGLLRRQIEAMGFATVGAGSWAEAQQKLGEIEPAAIILDFKLPDSDAAHILGEIRNQYPVIVLTGYGSIPNAVSAIREGAADFLTKPVQTEVLAAAGTGRVPAASASRGLAQRTYRLPGRDSSSSSRDGTPARRPMEPATHD